MKKIILSIVCLVATVFASAQGPTFQWAKKFGALSDDVGNSVAVDASGNVYTTGTFNGTVDFDPGAGTFNLTSTGTNLFISKLDASGNFVWAKKTEGNYIAVPYSITTDVTGNIYTTGYFFGTVDFDPGVGTSNLVSAGLDDIFVLKLDALGNFVWAKSMGGASHSIAYSILVDALGNVYTTGNYDGSVDFDPGAGVSNIFTNGNSDVFISKLDATGNFVWAKSIGGNSLDNSRSIALNASNEVFITGDFIGTADFDPGVAIFNLSATGFNDMFVLKLDASCNLVWAKRVGGSGSTKGYSIKLDPLGDVYTTGYFSGITDFDPADANVVNVTMLGGEDLFVLKLDASGNFGWVKQIGGSNAFVESYALVLDLAGCIYTTGGFFGTADFDPGVGSFNLTSSNVNTFDIFISKLDASGNFIWAKKMGGNGDDFGKSITVNASGNIYTTGSFEGLVDFDPGAGTSNLISAGLKDIFVHKMSEPVGIAKIDYDSNFLIYPNPTNGLFTIELITKGEITITNTLGEVVLNQTFEAGKQNINLQNQANGVYFVKVVSEGKQQVSKLVKQ